MALLISPPTVIRPLKILVIDDDPIVLETLRERLTRRGYHVATRDQALGSTHAVRTERPDMVLLDVMMPVLNGDHLADLLHADPATSDVSIVLHSSKSGAELAGIVEQTRALGAIQKTADAESFLQAFDVLADRHRRRRSGTGTR